MAGPKADLRRRFRALNDYIDVLVGRLRQKVSQLGVADSTIIIFCADMPDAAAHNPLNMVYSSFIRPNRSR